jgi:hypothetical protein
MADDVQVTFGANIQQLTAAVAEVKAQLGSLNGVVSQVGGYFAQLGNIGGVVATTLGALGLEAFTRKMVESGLETEKLTTALGISGKQLATLKAIAGLTGVDMSSLALTMERLSLNVQRSTKDAFSPASEALKVLGLQAKDLIGLNADQYFFKLADAAAQFNPSLNLTNALMAIGGRGMTEMVAAFVKGGSEFRELAVKIAAAKGEVDSFTKATMETHLQLGYMDATVGGLQKSIFLALKPAIDAIIINTREFVKEINDSIKAGAEWKTILNGIGLVLKGIVALLDLAAFGVAMLANAWQYLKAVRGGGDAVEAFTTLGKNSQESLDRLVKKLDELAGVEKTGEAAMESARKKLAEMIGTVQTGTGTVGKFNQAWTQMMNDLAGKKDAPSMNTGGRDALAAQMKAIDEQIKLLDMEFDKKKILYERDVLNFQMTEAQKVKATMEASNQRYEQQLALLQKELQLGGLTLAQKQDIENKITEIEAKAVLDRLRLQNEYVVQVRQQWAFLEQALQNSLNSSLRGLLQGTMTFKNAMKNIFQELVFAIINEFTKLAIVKPMIAALSDAFAPAELLSNVLKMISKFIGQVFSGATAFFAPTLGPAAPAAGAAVAAATEATALSYDTGAWAVPQTAHALVHRDEMILPVDMASAVRAIVTGGQGMGGAPANISIQAWDGASVMKWLRGGGVDVIAKALSGHYQANPASRPNF